MKKINGFIDAHCHLNDEKFAHDIEQTFCRMREFDVVCAIVSGSGIEGSKMALEIAHEHENVGAIIGFHPHETKDLDDKALSEIEELAKDNKVVGYGEIGLDFHYNISPPEIQKEAFKVQLGLAQKLSLPIVIHEREAFLDVWQILKDNGGAKNGGHWHCITTELENAKIIAEEFYIGITGIVSFNKSQNIKEIVSEIPLNKMLLETDAPYLAPIPYRGKRNEPSFIPIIANNIAELKNISVEEVKKITTENTLIAYPRLKTILS